MSNNTIFISQVKIIDPRSPWHGQIKDLKIQEGIIYEVHDIIENNNVINGNGCLLFPGSIDTGVSCGAPGFEYREDFQSVKKCMEWAGIMDVIVFPEGNPMFDRSPAPFQNKDEDNVKLHFFGCVSKHGEGKEMAELYDLYTQNVKGFCDGRSPVTNAALLKKTLEYTASFGIPVCNRPEDVHIASGGKMHEGNVHVSLGLKGIPELAESLMLERDIALTEYTGGMYHALSISTREGVNKIKQAKEKGLQVTASVNIMNLLALDKELSAFNGNLKLQPPLRDESHQEALFQGLKEGVIDVIRSDHAPFSPEEKEVEFDYTPYGAIQLQTMNSLYFTYLKDKISLDEWVFHTALKPSEIFGIQRDIIQEGNTVQVVLFNPSADWVLNMHTNQSKSRNTVWWNSPLKGRAIQIYRSPKK